MRMKQDFHELDEDELELEIEVLRCIRTAFAMD